MLAILHEPDLGLSNFLGLALFIFLSPFIRLSLSFVINLGTPFLPIIVLNVVRLWLVDS